MSEMPSIVKINPEDARKAFLEEHELPFEIDDDVICDQNGSILVDFSMMGDMGAEQARLVLEHVANILNSHEALIAVAEAAENVLGRYQKNNEWTPPLEWTELETKLAEWRKQG